jgi:hypothetical protein
MHGAGSPQAQRVMISRLVDLKLDVQVFVNLPNSCVEKIILIRGIRPVCLWSKFFTALDLNKLPKNLKIE